MPRQRAPGVYFEPADSLPRPVAEVRTDIAGFVGVAERGPLHQPIKVESWTQFVSRFGDRIEEGFLAYAVKGFFANRGTTCWIVRVGVPTSPANRASLLLVNRHQMPVFRVWARDYGLGAEQISIRVEPMADRFSLILQIDGHTEEVWRDLRTDKPKTPRDKPRYVCDVVNGIKIEGMSAGPGESELRTPGSVLIEIEDLGGPKGDKIPAGVASPLPRSNIAATVHWQTVAGISIIYEARPAGSLLSTSTVPASGFLGDERRATPVLDGLKLEHFTGEGAPPDTLWGLKTLDHVDEVSIVAMPDLMWPGVQAAAVEKPRPRNCNAIPTDAQSPTRPPRRREDRDGFSHQDQLEGQRALIRLCASTRNCFGVVDTRALQSPDDVIKAAESLQCETGQFAAIYYPWLYVPDPRSSNNVRLVPPSGHVAGMMARVDRESGVHKPPANEVLDDVRGVEMEIDADTHGMLNDAGVNAIRPTSGRGIRVAGARTLVKPTAAESRQWRYVNVRRLVGMIEEAIDRATQWVVFEGNMADKWRDVDRVVRNFLNGEWRRGRLDGATAEDAFHVICNDSTNPNYEIDNGRLICEIGLRPPLPSEFVIVRLGRRVGETGVVELGGAAHA